MGITAFIFLYKLCTLPEGARINAPPPTRTPIPGKASKKNRKISYFYLE